MNKLGFGIIGYGHIGKRHAAHIINHPEADLIALADNNPSQLKKAPADTTLYNDYRQLLENKKVDVVCICTPNFLHAGQTIACLQAGKHAVTEKPMALSTDECLKMIAAEKQSGKHIFAVKQNRYNPPVVQVKQLIEQDGLGEIYMVQVNCFWNRGDEYYNSSTWRGTKAQDGGCLFTQFSHFVDILYYLNGGFIKGMGAMRNFAHKHNTEFEDTGTFVMQAENGSLVNFNFTTNAFQQNMEGAITIFGENGTVKIGGQYLNTIEYQHIDHLHLEPINISAKANDYGLYQGSMSNHDEVIDNVVKVLLHQGRIMTSATEGMKVIEMIEMMYRSAQT